MARVESLHSIHNVFWVDSGSHVAPKTKWTTGSLTASTPELADPCAKPVPIRQGNLLRSVISLGIPFCLYYNVTIRNEDK